MTETKVKWSEIDHNKCNISEAIGVPEELFENYFEKAYEENLWTLLEKAGLEISQVIQVIDSDKSNCLTRIVSELWSESGKGEEISLQEFAEMSVLVLIVRKNILGLKFQLLLEYLRMNTPEDEPDDDDMMYV